MYEEHLLARHDLKPRAQEYRLGCIKVLLKTWPDLDARKLKHINETACHAWAKQLLDAGYDEHYFNQTLSTLRQILDVGELAPSPAMKVKRRGVRLKELQLPEPKQFEALLENMEQGGGGHSCNAADLVRFLAFSGFRLSESRKVTWADVDLGQGFLWVENVK